MVMCASHSRADLGVSTEELVYLGEEPFRYVSRSHILKQVCISEVGEPTKHRTVFSRLVCTPRVRQRAVVEIEVVEPIAVSKAHLKWP
jgi:hypothetical protein